MANNGQWPTLGNLLKRYRPRMNDVILSSRAFEGLMRIADVLQPLYPRAFILRCSLRSPDECRFLFFVPSYSSSMFILGGKHPFSQLDQGVVEQFPWPFVKEGVLFAMPLMSGSWLEFDPCNSKALLGAHLLSTQVGQTDGVVDVDQLLRMKSTSWTNALGLFRVIISPATRGLLLNSLRRLAKGEFKSLKAGVHYRETGPLFTLSIAGIRYDQITSLTAQLELGNLEGYTELIESASGFGEYEMGLEMELDELRLWNLGITVTPAADSRDFSENAELVPGFLCDAPAYRTCGEAAKCCTLGDWPGREIIFADPMDFAEKGLAVRRYISAIELHLGSDGKPAADVCLETMLAAPS